jgi:IclR family pca regulon transcriptional regulator
MPPPTDNLFVQSVAKCLAVLEALSARQQPLSLSELAERAGMDRSTAQRMAHTLTVLGYLEKGPQGKGLVLGKKLLDRTFDYLSGHPLIERATPVLADLQRETGERIDLSLFDDLSIIYALRRQSKRETFFATLVGRRIPTFCSAGGRAVMSCLPDAAVDDILARSELVPMTSKTIVDVETIRIKVAESRTRNFSLSLEECHMGELAVACAILDQDRRPVAAVHITGSCADWMPDVFVKRFAPLVMEAARALSMSAR